MSRLEWDQVGERKFETGVDRGVLYLSDVAVPWNGLTGIEEVSSRKVQPYFQDGMKYMNSQLLGHYEANLKAFTYPDEFDRCLGIEPNGNGVSFHDQLGETFGLSYRTLIGDDISGVERGYIIHVCYNLTAVPSSISYSTMGGQVSPMEFSWNLSSTPEVVSSYRPTAHATIRSTDVDAGSLESFEAILYGSDGWDAYLPSVTELASI
jgi:hypothetical protein